MIVLSGAELVLPDRILTPGTIVIDAGRIADIRPGALAAPPPFAFHNHYIVPGFIDVHVHGVEGVDVLDGTGAIRSVARALPRYGVTAFCPTTVATTPAMLGAALTEVQRLRAAPPAASSRVLPAHIESSFINPEYAGAQPAACLRSARMALNVLSDVSRTPPEDERNSSGAAILAELDRHAPDVAFVTIASELDGGLDLIDWLMARQIRAALGHSGATYDEAMAAISAGASHATHLFNRMPPLGHRAPGLAGAVLQSDEIAAEIVCDGHHVHPALIRTAIAAKRPQRICAISDGTAVSGFARPSVASLGGEAVFARETGAYRKDGTLAGSTVTMDVVFRRLVERVGVSLVDASVMCATTPARELGLVGYGVLARDAVADLVVLDSSLQVVQTYIAGDLVYSRASA